MKTKGNTMKKLFISLLVIALMAGAMGNVCIIASADAIGTPVFDLDLSTGTWGDKSVSQIQDFWNVDNAKLPTVGSFENISGTVKYLDFEGAKGIVANGSTFASSDELTVETWAYLNKPIGYPDMFGISSGSIGNSIMGAEFFYWNNEYRVWYNGIDTGVSGGSFEKWSHYVFTRKWDEVAKTITISAYIDGTLIHSTSWGSETRPSTDNKHLYIGNSGTSGDSLQGKVATFKVYNSVLASTEIQSNYTTGKDAFSFRVAFDLDLSTGTWKDGSENHNTDFWYNNNNNLPSVNSIQSVNGTTNYLDFAGADAIVVNGNGFASSDELTVETWAYANKPIGFPDMFGLSSGSLGNSIMGVELYKWAGIYHLWYNGRDINMNVAGFDKWSHYVFTRKWDNATKTITVSVYIDGVLVDTNSWASAERPSTDDKHLYIGNSGTAGGVFEGKIATFKVYNDILDSNEIQSNYTAGKAAVSPRLAFDLDLSTGTWKDGSENHNTDFWYNNPSNLPIVESMQTSSGTTNYLDFNGAAAIVVNGNGFAGSDELTVETWANINTPIGYPDLFGLSSGSLGNSIMGAEFFAWNNEYRVWYNGTDTGVNSSSFEKWSHYVFTRKWDEATKTITVSLYIDGTLIHSTSLASETRPSTSDKHLYIGGSGTSGDPIKGKIATFKVYQDVLASDEIQSKYNADKYLFNQKLLPNVIFFDQNELQITELNNSVTTLYADITMTHPLNESVNYWITLALYDANGLVSTDMVNGTLNGNATTDVANLALTNVVITDTTYAKLFIWEGSGQTLTMKPLIDFISVPHTQGGGGATQGL